MQNLTIDEIKSRSILILKDIKRVCNELNLTYFLDSGTLLGAVRHNGFIPWDDDIDVTMSRPDYEIFIREYNQHCVKQYRLVSIENMKSYPYPYAKVYDTSTILYENGIQYCGLGLSVDIFPIDAFPNSEAERNIHWKKSVDLFSAYASMEGSFLSHYSWNPVKFKQNVRVFFARHGSFRKKAILVAEYAKSINWNDADYVGVSVCMYYRNRPRYVSKDCFIPIEHLFEGEMYLIPEGYDAILKSMYGDDYMTPPPKDKRNSTHGLEIYYK